MRLSAEQFRTLYLEHGPRAQGFFMRMMGYNVQVARDMVQDLFTRIWEHRDTFRTDASFTTWMFSIAYNMCKNEYRHREIVQAYQEHIMATTTEIGADADTLEQKQRRQMLQGWNNSSAGRCSHRPSTPCPRARNRFSCCVTTRN